MFVVKSTQTKDETWKIIKYDGREISIEIGSEEQELRCVYAKLNKIIIPKNNILTKLAITDSTISLVEWNLLRDLTELDISGSHIKLGNGLILLKRLIATDSWVESLPNDLFNLEYLDCSHAHALRELPPGLDNLKVLVCKNTKIKTVSLTNLLSINCSFSDVRAIDCPNIRILICSECRNINVLQEYKYLKHLACYRTNINHLSEYKNLRFLDCSYTKIVTLPNYPKLRKLKCFQPISELPRCRYLKYLEISSKKIKYVPHYKYLKHLDCEGVNICTIPEFKYLTYLVLNKTKVKVLPILSSLKFIECSKTMIEEIPYIKLLEHINANNSKLKKIPIMLENLKILYIEETRVPKLHYFFPKLVEFRNKDFCVVSRHLQYYNDIYCPEIAPLYVQFLYVYRVFIQKFPMDIVRQLVTDIYKFQFSTLL